MCKHNAKTVSCKCCPAPAAAPQVVVVRGDGECCPPRSCLDPNYARIDTQDTNMMQPMIVRASEELAPAKLGFRTLKAGTTIQQAAETAVFVDQLVAEGFTYIVLPGSSAIVDRWIADLAALPTPGTPTSLYPKVTFIANSLGTQQINPLTNIWRFIDLDVGNTEYLLANVLTSANLPNFVAGSSRFIFANDGSAAIAATSTQITAAAVAKFGAPQVVPIVMTWGGTDFAATDYDAIYNAVNAAPAGSVLAVSMSAAGFVERYVAWSNSALTHGGPAPGNILTPANTQIDLFLEGNFFPILNTTTFDGLPSNSVDFYGFDQFFELWDVKILDALQLPFDKDLLGELDFDQYADELGTLNSYLWAANCKKSGGVDGLLRFDQNRQKIAARINISNQAAGSNVFETTFEAPNQNPRWVTAGSRYANP